MDANENIVDIISAEIGKYSELRIVSLRNRRNFSNPKKTYITTSMNIKCNIDYEFELTSVEKYRLLEKYVDNLGKEIRKETRLKHKSFYKPEISEDAVNHQHIKLTYEQKIADTGITILIRNNTEERYYAQGKHRQRLELIFY